MLQAIMVNPGVIEFNNISIPSPKKDEVLIHIKRIGVCGSDIHVYHGLHPYTKYPIVQGHEVSGVVEKIGADVKDFTVGDHVVIMPQEFCGKCYPCKHGMYHICDELKVLGFQANGAAQEYFAFPASMTLKVSPKIDLDFAAMVEPLSVAVHAVNRAGSIKGKNVIVIGAGTIGNLVAQSAMQKGAAKVLISDISDFKLDKAKQSDIPAVVNPAKEDIAKKILDTFGPDKADIIFECVGVEDSIGQAIANARKGSTIIVVGVFGKKPVVDIGLVQDRELNLIGSLMYKKEDYEDSIALLEKNKLKLQPLITNRFSFNEYLAAYEFIENAKGNSLKVMVHLD